MAGHLSRKRGEKAVKQVARMFGTMLCEFGDMLAAEVSRSHAFELIESVALAGGWQAGGLGRQPCGRRCLLPLAGSAAGRRHPGRQRPYQRATGICADSR